MQNSDEKYKIGDLVRIVSMPSVQPERTPQETIEIFQTCVGKVFEIEGFNEHGLIEIKVNNLNYIWIEKECVEKVYE